MKKNIISKKNIIAIAIPLASVIACSFLLFSSLDKKMADLFQRPLKSTEESSEVIMINIDDDAVEQIGTWPFSRTVYAKMLATLKELGAKSVVFDLSFLDRSQASVDEKYVKESLPGYVEDYFSLLNDVAEESFDALADRSATLKEARNYYGSESKKYQNELNTAISHVITPVDEVLASSINEFGNTFLTLTFENGIQPTDEEKEFLESYIALENVVAKKDTVTKEYTGVQPALYDFITQAKSAGFVNADPDRDGYLRRIHPVVKYNGKYYAQLVFRPILDMMGNPTVEITNRYIKAGDLKIPRAKDGSVIIKYPKKKYRDYRCLSLANIYFLSTMENTFLTNLKIMADSGFFEDLDEEENPYELYGTADYIKGELANGEDAENGITFDEYIRYRKLYVESSRAFLTEDTENYFCTIFPDDADYVHELFDQTKTAFDKFCASYEKCQGFVQGAMCIVGTNASSTTDYGLNQYEEHYPNPGVHYALANQILSRDFVDDSPAIISIIIALILSLAYSFGTREVKRTDLKIALGIISVVFTGGILLLIFVLTRCYIGTVIPLLSVFITIITTTVIAFVNANHDKKFITNAFGQCLSPAVVQEIVANPDSFKLGGIKVDMTAIFTDIQKFSSFSELLSAGQLVALLNYYLTKMSDIIMDERGTVDKYEGDAIIAFIGAPLKCEDHAARACSASIKMKEAEKEINAEIVKIAGGEKPQEMEQNLYDAFCIMVKNGKQIFTRIGLNSGEMIAGYMGSEGKKNYTMMGNNVNLASRLEGVNKQYSTGGILMSEATRKMLGDRFIVRSLDRVRVVNVNTPIRLYELICERSSASGNTIAYYEKWEKALSDFEAQQYDSALEQFKALSGEKEDDKVCAYYIRMCQDFFCKGKYPTETDDVGVAYNPDDGVFKLLQK